MPDRIPLPAALAVIASTPLAELRTEDTRAVVAWILRKPVVAPLEVAAFNSAI